MDKELIRKAVSLFPRREYTNPASVRHARRMWLQSVAHLRCAPGGSLWVVDRKVGRAT
jgi:hypothetical protein